MHFKKQTQVGILLFNKVLTEVLAKYSDYSNVFLVENVAKLLENTRINEHAIKLKRDKQLLFSPIYNLKLVKLKILKTYIKTNLANGFIWFFRSLGRAIFFLIESHIEIFAFMWIIGVLIISLSKTNICYL